MPVAPEATHKGKILRYHPLGRVRDVKCSAPLTRSIYRDFENFAIKIDPLLAFSFYLLRYVQSSYNGWVITQFMNNVRLSESILYNLAFHNSNYGGGQGFYEMAIP